VLIVAPSAELVGVQTPRFSWAPPSLANAAEEVIELCEQIGMPLDEWQQTSLILMLGERAGHKWSAFEVAIIVARQNGKGGILEARELGGLFLFGEQLIIHSAHEFATASEAFLRMKGLIDNIDWLRKRVKSVSESHGQEGFVLMSGQRLSYRTRTAGGGRGFSGDTVILDEAQNVNSRQIAALMPTLSARPNPQLIYAGTVAADAKILRSLVERGRKGGDAHLAYAEFSAPDDADPTDVAALAQANPALGIRITLDYLEAERVTFLASGSTAEYLMERLSIWPEVAALGSLIPLEEWKRCLDPDSAYPDGVRHAMGVAISPKRDWASVAIAWYRPDGSTHVQVVRHDPGTDWLLPYLVERVAARAPLSLVVDQMGPAGTLLAAMGAAGLKVRATDTAAYKSACAGFVDSVKYARIRHRGQQPLTDAAAGVKEHRVGDSFVYARRDSSALISPLEAVTLAVWGLTPEPRKKEFFMLDLNSIDLGETE